MEEKAYGNWSYELEMEECLCHTNNIFDEEFLKDILNQTVPQDQSSVPVATTGLVNNNSSINVSHSTQHAAEKLTSSLPIPTTYILSYDKSTTLLPPTEQHHDSLPLSSSKANQGSNSKKTRKASETLDHIITERNRRRELTRKFIELSAFIPGLKKTDKVHVLIEAVKYVKQLQERVKEVEEDIKKKGAGSLIAITRSHLLNDNDTVLGEMNTKECYGHNKTFPELEVRVLGKEVLIKIHCGKQKGIVVNIILQLQILHLSITTTNVLPFGNTLNITIIAQMGDKYNLTVKDLVKKLRVVATLQACDDVQQ